MKYFYNRLISYLLVITAISMLLLSILFVPLTQIAKANSTIEPGDQIVILKDVHYFW